MRIVAKPVKLCMKFSLLLHDSGNSLSRVWDLRGALDEKSGVGGGGTCYVLCFGTGNFACFCC